MTTYFPFVPDVQAPFAFQPTLDGQQYAANVTWNLFGQRWYVNVKQLTGALVFSLPLLGSPDGVSIESITWSFGVVTVVTARPHQYTVGEVIAITITGCTPTGYNGVVLAFIEDTSTFTYQLAADPGLITQLGAEIFNLNLAGGYFDTSTLVFRASSQTFEVTP